jgi:hypothetical protein
MDMKNKIMIEYNLKGKLASFEESFFGGISGCSMECQCGKLYYDAYNTGYDWEEGEFEGLEEDEEALAVNHSVGTLYIGGKEYVCVCKCWHEKANEIIKFIDSNSHQIANYLSLEKEKASKDAAKMPTVREGWINMDGAPLDSRNIKVRDKDGKEFTAHYACDLSGEEQPPFKGWFTKLGNSYVEVFPVEWKKI